MGLQTVVFGDLPGGSTYMIEDLASFPGLMAETSGTQFGTLAFQKANLEGATFPLCLLDRVSRSKDDFLAVDVNGQSVKAPVVVVASGRTPKRLAVENDQIRGLHFCSICDGPMYRDKDAVLAVVGGGNPAAQHALALARIAKQVYLVCRSAALGCDDAHLKRLRALDNVTIMLNSEVVSVKGLDGLEALVVSQAGQEVKEVSVEGLFQAIGWEPNTAFIDLEVDKTADGYLKTDERLMTSASGLFAVGDVRDTDMWQVLTACADGARAAKYAFEFLESR
jgi:thioredoxin reductase (NADPH)